MALGHKIKMGLPGVDIIRMKNENERDLIEIEKIDFEKVECEEIILSGEEEAEDDFGIFILSGERLNPTTGNLLGDDAFGVLPLGDLFAAVLLGSGILLLVLTFRSRCIGSLTGSSGSTEGGCGWGGEYFLCAAVAGECLF